MAGLLGIGGGLIIVPALFLLYKQLAFPEALILHMALGSSLATIVFTSLTSITTHHYINRSINWLVFRTITPALIIGALLGGLLVDFIETSLLKFFFISFELFVAMKMLDILPHSPMPIKVSTGLYRSVSFFIGLISALVGIGGGTMTVPMLMMMKMPIKAAISLSAACGLPIAFFASLSYVIAGSDKSLPVASTGFIYWPAVFWISVMSMITAPIGAKLSQRLNNRGLKKIFAFLLIFIALKMIFIL